MMATIRVLVLSLTGFVGTACATTPELHVVGVYEGEATSGAEDEPWWAECEGAGGRARSSGAPAEARSNECHDKHAEKRQEKEVAVNVGYQSKPIVLALTAYEPTHWKVSRKKGVEITRVILGGYHSQRVTGLADGTPVEVHTHEPSPCEQCRQGEGHFHAYESVPRGLTEVTDLEVSSFQGKYRAGEFYISPDIKASE